MSDIIVGQGELKVLKLVLVGRLPKNSNNREEIIANIELLIDMAKENSPLEAKIDELEQHLETIRQDIEDLVDRKARKAQNQELYQEQYDTLVTAYQEKQKELQEAKSALEEQKSKRLSLDGFIQSKSRMTSSQISTKNSVRPALNDWI